MVEPSSSSARVCDPGKAAATVRAASSIPLP